MRTHETAQISDAQMNERLRGDIRRLEVQQSELDWTLSRAEEDLTKLRELLAQVEIRRCRSITGLDPMTI